jgi:hypothetical protein
MEKNYKRKMLVIGVLFLFLGASATLCVSATGPWTENFDSYVAGSALEGQGGWHAWDNIPVNTGYVSNAQSRSAPNSVEIAWWSTTVWTDEVHEYTDINSGIWTYTAWQYVPSTQVGNTYFILLNTYVNGVHNNQDWSLQLVASASLGTIVDYNDATATLPLVTDAWAEIKVVIDLDTDWQTVSYNGVILQPGKGWTDGAGFPGGALNLGAVDLYSDAAYSTSVYYDDMSVLPAGDALICGAGGPYNAEINTAVQFTGTASGGTTPYTWAWTFGDGGTAVVQNPTHTYTTAGTYNVTLTVTDAVAGTATDTTTATIIAPQPVLEIGAITGGFGIKSSVKNTGVGAATNVDWTIALDGKLVFVGKSSTGTITTLAPAGNQAIKAGFILGFGKTNIVVSATCDEGVTAEATASGFVLGPFILGVK